jgi:hypothetical protein
VAVAIDVGEGDGFAGAGRVVTGGFGGHAAAVSDGPGRLGIPK